MIEKGKNECTINERKIVVNLLKGYVVLKNKHKLNLLTNSEQEIYHQMTSALVVLKGREQEVIQLTYIDNEDDVFDYVIQDKLRLSARTYYRIKDSAINKIYSLLPNSLFNAS